MKNLYLFESVVEIASMRMSLREFFEANKKFNAVDAIEIASDLLILKRTFLKATALDIVTTTFDAVEIKLVALAFINDDNFDTFELVDVVSASA